jgi:hypothetical protein
MFKIKNGNDFDFSARYDGREYTFPAGKTRACDDDAAHHIFGLGSDNKMNVLTRHGWVKPLEPISVGMAVLNKFAFELIQPKLDVPMATDGPEEDEGDEPETVAQDADQKVPRAPGQINIRERLAQRPAA